MVNVAQYQSVINGFINKNVQLVAVSKLQPKESIILLYQNSQKDFGENYVQELLEKQQQLPADIRWHFIGHLQSNKVKYIAPFIYLIQG
ncbi:MAG: YggS family pyridoxal phosphate-dependent enzyme, partial [Ferruginibacter sp.]|nr:YggS family pyridoxal phosphate-dependent enzyme [Ferruginibacter sp.]